MKGLYVGVVTSHAKSPMCVMAVGRGQEARRVKKESKEKANAEETSEEFAILRQSCRLRATKSERELVLFQPSMFNVNKM